jgi:hypothetical protein
MNTKQVNSMEFHNTKKCKINSKFGQIESLNLK